MKLCFDATRFGCGLDGAVELASHRGINSIEYSFAPFAPAGRSSGKGGASKKAAKGEEEERLYLEQVKGVAQSSGVDFAIINLDYAFDVNDKKAHKLFQAMLGKLSQVATALACPRLGVSLLPTPDFVSAFTAFYQGLKDDPAIEQELVLRLITPVPLRGLSLAKWRHLEPQEWRDLLAACPGLSLAYCPADALWLGLDYLQNMSSFAQAISHVVACDLEINRSMLNDSGLFGPLWWRYRLAGKGQVDFKQVIELLKLHDFQGAFSMHFEDEFLSSEDSLQHLEALDESVKYFSPLLKY